jgi:hypothetical protein
MSNKPLSEMNPQELEAAEVQELANAWELYADGITTVIAYEMQQEAIKKKYAPFNGEAYEDEHGNLNESPAAYERARRIYGL